MNVDINSTENEPDLIIDGLIGYSLSGNPREKAAEPIAWANDTSTPVLALDIPSGFSISANKVFEPAIKATATMTLALPKAVLFDKDTKVYVGELYLADISVPVELYAKPPLNLELGHIFSKSPILRLG